MNALKQSIYSWWSSITRREQRLVVICASLIALATIYLGVIQPMSVRSEQAQTRINSEKQLLNWVENKADKITSLRSSGGRTYSNTPMNQVVSSSVTRYRMELVRIQPRDESLQVWVKPVSFNQLIDWLAFLKETQDIGVEFMELSATDAAGMVEVKRLQLKRGI
ncbi:type II secretion system protein M [Vibrio hannami]|uniref:type II secretion system protein M n=1 Tax=Vibrio hannami TaxID=2717094 RepID=UPI002410905F|nr:type II secretion system protein M [Vibrio hannami]MDG3086861.1 type II secretion system protein M [Vibrio hannami]